jgi:RNA polymerase sigma-70 factor, ECF subfamily
VNIMTAATLWRSRPLALRTGDHGGASMRRRDALLEVEWFAELYNQHFDGVFRYACMLTRDTATAEDVASDAFLRAWEARGSLRNPQAAVTWLLSITRNCAMDALRAQQKGTVDLSAIPEPMDPDPEGPGPEASDELRLRLEEAIRELSPEQQQVLFLRFYERRSHEEVASRLGKNPNAIRVIQYRALGRLRKLLEGSRG